MRRHMVVDGIQAATLCGATRPGAWACLAPYLQHAHPSTLMSTGARRFCRSFLCTQRKFISTSCTLSSLTRMVAGTPVMKATSFLLVLQQEEEGKAIADRAPANMHAHNGAAKVHPGPCGATAYWR